MSDSRPPLNEMLASGDLRSNGMSREVAELVLRSPDLSDELLDVLLYGEPSARGHAADALERVSRSAPDRVIPYLICLLPRAETDPDAMVRWHLGIALTKLAIYHTMNSNSAGRGCG